MLRIKEGIDLKELEKFGFKKYANGYYKKVYLKNDNDDKNFYEISKHDRIIELTRLDGELDDTLYDLIKADMVERI
jgi:hypothetical protein